MKWIIVSDIHANLPALEAVFADIEERFPGIFSNKTRPEARIASLGDQIGYHPYRYLCCVSDKTALRYPTGSVQNERTQFSQRYD